MAFLDKSVSVFVDAVLTEVGRQRLATTGNLNISKFAVSDDGVDYGLFDITNTQGDYDKVILNMPLLEATTRTVAVTEAGTDAAMKYKLIDALDGTVDSVNITGVPVSTETNGSFDYAVISPVTENLANQPFEQYTVTLADDTYVDIFADGETVNVTSIGYESGEDG
ncbi:uncharacterized protein METZ01_LOCUS318965 [marine metagenome]|uniref:Uncharacterized protein n=1 Tax=marine metagenome TaxID=408172 RepID=A0A382P2Q2_9ZZZZ